MDFLGHPFGLNYEDVVDWAIDIEIQVAGDPVTFKVMHPVHCLESRISNVGGLPGYKTRLALDQARSSVSCAREYLRDRLDQNDDLAAKAVCRLNERIYRFTWSNSHSRSVLCEHGIDSFDAILLDHRLPQKFVEVRYPQMQRNLERKRAKGRNA